MASLPRVNPPYDVPMSACVPESVLVSLPFPPNDISRCIDAERGDVAALILDAGGLSFCGTPSSTGVHSAISTDLRSSRTRTSGAVISQGVITGFAIAPVVFQATSGVTLRT